MKSSDKKKKANDLKKIFLKSLYKRAEDFYIVHLTKSRNELKKDFDLDPLLELDFMFSNLKDFSRAAECHFVESYMCSHYLKPHQNQSQKQLLSFCNQFACKNHEIIATTIYILWKFTFFPPIFLHFFALFIHPTGFRSFSFHLSLFQSSVLPDLHVASKCKRGHCAWANSYSTC